MNNDGSSRSLFDNIENAQPAPSPPSQWLFVTNHMNLCHILSSGLIPPPRGFRKYYRDPLSLAPGWVPIHADRVPLEALEMATEERKTLRSCILELDLSNLEKGRFKGLDSSGEMRDVDMDTAVSGGFVNIYPPAPLPVSIVRSVAFKTREDLEAFKDVASYVNNVPAANHNIKVAKKLFNASRDPGGLARPMVDEEHPAPINKALALGGVIAMLANIAHMGDLAMEMYRQAKAPGAEAPPAIDDPRLACLGAWIHGDDEAIRKNGSAANFWKIVDILAESQAGARSGDYLDGILSLLRDHAEAGGNESLKELTRDLARISGFADLTFTELFEKHKTPSSKALALLFSGVKIKEFIEFQHPLFQETERILAAILFGARDGWPALPLELRDYPDLENFISQTMAELAHQRIENGLRLKQPPQTPYSLRELLSPDKDKGWDAKQKKAALYLARKSKWDCLETHIKLPKGEYRVQVDGGGLHIIINEDVKVETDVRQEEFFIKLAAVSISRKLESEVRSVLRG